MKEVTSKSHYLKFEPETCLYSLVPLHRRQREMQILILNPQYNEKLYRTVVRKYPNARITTIGDVDRDTHDGSTHLRLQFQNMSEYTLHAILGSPRIDLMIINPPPNRRVRFAGIDRKEFDRMFALFQMISPKFWIFTTSEDPSSSEQNLEHSRLFERLDVKKYFQGQVWTNLEHKFDLRSPKGYSQMLPFKQLRNGLASDESRND